MTREALIKGPCKSFRRPLRCLKAPETYQPGLNQSFPRLNTQRGAALLIIMALVIAGMVVLATTALSINLLRDAANQKSTASLKEAQKALLGYALNSIPPGQLPCPDDSGDGIEDTSGGSCSSPLGRLPFRTLMLPALRDGYNNELWYALNQNLRSGSSLNKNSSTTTTLHLDTSPLAAILIAPNRALNNQNRNNNSPVSDYLEGVNADTNTNNYSRVIDGQHNDIILALDYQPFWSLIEESVLKQASSYLTRYKAACTFYPWAASSGMAPYNSVDTLQKGRLPFNSALPVEWNSGCASGITPPNWLDSHWGSEIYYVFCTSSEGSCLSLSGDTNSTSEAILVAPGIRLSGQTRATFVLTDYYENSNAIPDNNFFMRFNKHLSGSFNDVLLSLSP